MMNRPFQIDSPQRSRSDGLGEAFAVHAGVEGAEVMGCDFFNGLFDKIIG